MRESVKAVLALVFIVAGITALGTWFVDQPTHTTWYVRIGAIIVGVFAICALLKLHFQADEAPDFLRAVAGTYFNRNGFCFVISPTLIDGVCYFDAHFQNQQDRPSRGRIALRPVRGFFLNRANIDVVTFDIECEPAAFGVARVAVLLAKKVQGTQQTFEVGASVSYPEGKGRRLRYHDGLLLRANAEFGNAFGTALTVVGAMSGTIVMTRPAKATLPLPRGAAEEILVTNSPVIQTLWKLGNRLPDSPNDVVRAC